MKTALYTLKNKLDAMNKVGTNQKKELLQELNPVERGYMHYILNPFMMYGVKKYNKPEPLETSEVTDEEVILLLDDLRNRNITGSQAIEAVQGILAKMNEEEQDMFRRILLKTTKAGIGISVFNKVFPTFKIPVFEVQLATNYRAKGDLKLEVKNKHAKFPMIAQKKLDGMRIIVKVEGEDVEFLSRTGNPVTTLEHLKEQMVNLRKATGYDTIYFDGEGVVGSFNGTISALRKKGVKAVGAELWLFDWFLPEWQQQSADKSYATTGVKLRDRITHLIDWFKKTEVLPDVKLLPFNIIHSHEEYVAQFKARLDANEEGEMAKDPDAPYYFKRTRGWWKLKDENEADGEIIGFKPGDADSTFKDTLGSVTVRLENGVIVDASGIKHQYLDEIWRNQDKYIGRIVKVNFHELTPDGSLRHPRLKWPSCLRDDEDKIGDKE
ncbi:ATP-dependent DNA ligase [Providencia sp. MGF014]|uniref:ATP-dependent DNA ligase n=1 Tax=Providencia sp. MGF014 TaxID=2565573 RepID=UPI00109D7A36|nr:DNA ligase [Providencia sp. MGF014]THB27321.1 DNA ligase [Providencia sp. MGF014]